MDERACCCSMGATKNTPFLKNLYDSFDFHGKYNWKNVSANQLIVPANGKICVSCRFAATKNDQDEEHKNNQNAGGRYETASKNVY